MLLGTSLGALAAGWVGLLALLFAAGLALSRLQRVLLGRSARRLRQAPSLAERGVLRAYHAVILATAAFFYASIPLCGAAMLLAGAAAVSLSFAVAGGPLAFLLLAALLPFASLYALLRGVLYRQRDPEPGRRLARARQPELYAVTDEVAALLGTRGIDAIYLTAGTDMAVTARGGLWRRLRGGGERSLILGWAALHGLTLPQLKAILVHEYGHFMNGDLQLGALVRQVELSLLSILRGMARVGRLTYANPAYWMLRLFLRMYACVTSGSSRLREGLADRAAARLYGGKAFAEGLAHVLRQSAAFGSAVAALLRRHGAEPREALPCVYGLIASPAAALSLAELDRAAAQELQRAPSPGDSHPTPAQRVAWTRSYPGVLPADGAAAALGLFRDRAELEAEMSQEIDRRVREYVAVVEELRRAR